jgi:hypothetical protein
MAWRDGWSTAEGGPRDQKSEQTQHVKWERLHKELWNVHGEPPGTMGSPLSDIPANMWHAVSDDGGDQSPLLFQ